MKLSGHIAVTAVGLLVASAGVLMPLQGAIDELETEVRQLEDEAASSIPVQVEIQSLEERLARFQEDVATRTVALCPDTPAAGHAFETALARAVRGAGLRRVSMDRNNGQPVNGLPSFVIALRVEGTATQVHHLLVSLEELPWINRVMRLEIEKGEMVRTIDLSIAVMLEDDA